ncbi:Ribonucleases P/MRP protein subunit pop1 [Lithohypha guttulata]|nr:Ribonucleases P/MRP protein subunit pop1 [Lithohypha guttulata]
MAPLTAGQKRKVDYNASGTQAQARKRQKGKDARAVTTQTADAALSRAGELNIASFIKSRDFEIAALEQSMKKSKKSLTQRAFQQLPRHMRRRTASHNVKKIPRRLRGRASREMKEDNTPIGSARRRKASAKLRLRLETAKKLQKLNLNRKSAREKKREAQQNAKEPDPEKHISLSRVPRIRKSVLAGPPQATSKFKRRQVHKTWLPTHLWHTKRAHMTRPTSPLWRMAVPLRPTEKTYRPTHRAAGSRGCVAWDTSYTSTVGCLGTEAALESMLKALSFPGEGWVGARYRRWKAGTRFAEGWVKERDNEQKVVAPILVIWQAKSTPTEEPDNATEMDTDQPPLANDARNPRRKVKLDTKILVRVHPSAFYQFWQELLKVAKMQKPQVLVEDLRFEIGSITVSGPESTEALTSTLSIVQDQIHMHNLWNMLPSLRNPASLPQNAMLALDVIDPRCNFPPKQFQTSKNESNLQMLNEAIVAWPPDTRFPPSRLFDHKERYRTCMSLPSQRAINRQKRAVVPGEGNNVQEKGPKIPVLLLAHRSANRDSSFQGSWSVLLPWSCVDLVWRSLMYCPLSSGSTPTFGGLEQSRQVAFEHAVSWYPGDYPGLEAGKAWGRIESEDTFDSWIRRPPSKRFAWDTLDLGLGRKGEVGRGWACDWEYLFRDTLSVHASVELKDADDRNNNTTYRQMQLLTQRQRKAAAARAEKDEEERARRRNTSSPESLDDTEQLHSDVRYHHLEPSQAATLLNRFGKLEAPKTYALATVRIRLLTRGTPRPAARIYRLPLCDDGTDTNQQRSSTSTTLPQDHDRAASSAGMPAGPLLFPTTSMRQSDGVSSTALRTRWLALDLNQPHANLHSSTNLPAFQRKERRNHHDDPASHKLYDPKNTRDLSHIRVFPPHETKSEVLDMFGPRPLKKTSEELLKIIQPQLVPKMNVDKHGDLVEEDLWDKHVPCPQPGDLVGYVTTGGYSLSEGGGMAIGSVWVQRIIEGWKKEEKQSSKNADASNQDDLRANGQVDKSQSLSQVRREGNKKVARQDTQKVKYEKQRQKQVERERHLCIVRNAGESVGRLAIWELC